MGEGTNPKGIWPSEPSLLVVGIDLEDALALGRTYHQHAILFATAKGRTALLACLPETQSTTLEKEWLRYIGKVREQKAEQYAKDNQKRLRADFDLNSELAV